ncbi:MAG: metallophosphoesterase [Planctomycetes bacterium]|nr:metallophosphoesterase [Planctomycetota bacterium]
MRVWAISDLHLGFSTGKWMDVFGEHWKDHHLKVEAAWRAQVDAADIVLLPGDFSWAMKPRDVLEDLRWLAALPGRKVLIKGNHDYWWPGSHAKLKELLPPGVHAIKKRAIVIDGVAVIGVRGADFVAREGETPRDVETRLVRERGELLQSIEDLARQGGAPRPPIALFHYPPFPVGRSESAFTRIIEDTGCHVCLFGHLHARGEWQRVFQGEARGVRYRLVSCDFLGYAPLPVEDL